MAELDYLFKGLKVVVDDVVNVKSLYRLLRRHFEKMGYDYFEKEHLEDMKADDIRNLNIKMEGEKKVDDYTKFRIELRMKGNNLKPVMRDKELCASGTISVSFDAFLENDYEGRWERPFFLKFFRSFYDKYIHTLKYETNIANLKKETMDFVAKTKSFLKVEEFKK